MLLVVASKMNETGWALEQWNINRKAQNTRVPDYSAIVVVVFLFVHERFCKIEHNGNRVIVGRKHKLRYHVVN